MATRIGLDIGGTGINALLQRHASALTRSFVMMGEIAGAGQEEDRMTKHSGICVPVCTPFDESGENLDEGALRDHIDSMIEAGVHIVLVCGGTGEFATLRADEKRRIAEIAGRHIDGRAGFMVQTSAINTQDAIEYAKRAEGQGADAVMILPPYFEGPDRHGVRDHFERIGRAIHTPIMVYNIPQATNIDITPDFFRELLEIDNIESIKDSTADLVRIQQLLTTGGTVFNGARSHCIRSTYGGLPGLHLGGGERHARRGGGALRPGRGGKARRGAGAVATRAAVAAFPVGARLQRGGQGGDQPLGPPRRPLPAAGAAARRGANGGARESHGGARRRGARGEDRRLTRRYTS